MQDILYIMGTGRSGTTILEVLLRNNRGIFGMGEVTHILRDGLLLDQTCSCGQTASKCCVWGEVFQSLGCTKERAEFLLRVFCAVEGHAKFLSLIAHLIGRGKMNEYFTANEQLMNSISRVTGSKVLVDSSKYAGRALALAELFPKQVRVICVTRSAEGLIQTYKKKNEEEQKPQSSMFVSMYYSYVLLCMWYARRRLGNRCLSIRYEDLRAQPYEVLRRIEQWSGLDFSEARHKLVENKLMDVGHIITGNRLRKLGKVRFSIKPNDYVARGTVQRLTASVLETYRNLLRF